MTKKDYILLAGSIKESILDIYDFNLRASKEDIEEITKHIVNNLCLAMKAENPSFDTDKFFNACFDHVKGLEA